MKQGLLHCHHHHRRASSEVKREFYSFWRTALGIRKSGSYLHLFWWIYAWPWDRYVSALCFSFSVKPVEIVTDQLHRHFIKLNSWVLRKHFEVFMKKLLYVRKDKKEFEDLGNTWKRDSTTWPSPRNHRKKNKSLPFLDFISKGSLKLLSQMGKEVAPTNSWRISVLESLLCCTLAQPQSLLDCNVATLYACAHSQWDNTMLLAWWEERWEIMTTWMAGYLHSLLPAAVQARCHNCCYKTLRTNCLAPRSTSPQP